jgi:hypothetical protein
MIQEIAAPIPVVIGVNWYSNFDTPVDSAGNRYRWGAKPVGHWWVGRSSNLGQLRGGHCVCLKPRYQGTATDLVGWWDFYNQGAEGACVGFGCSRMMSIMNRKRFFARWLWDRSKEIDSWSDTNPGDDEGTSVRAALNILSTRGHVPWTNSAAQIQADSDYTLRRNLTPSLHEGIYRYRWMRSIDDCLSVLGYGDKDYVDILNSWGRHYPHLVRMPASVLERLWREDGEIGLVTDR